MIATPHFAYNNLHMDSFAKALKKRLKSENISRLSRELEIPKTLLFGWQVDRSPSFKNLPHIKKLADYFGVSLEELLFGEDDPALISSVMFEDNKRKYRIKIERLK